MNRNWKSFKILGTMFFMLSFGTWIAFGFKTFAMVFSVGVMCFVISFYGEKWDYDI